MRYQRWSPANVPGDLDLSRKTFLHPAYKFARSPETMILGHCKTVRRKIEARARGKKDRIIHFPSCSDSQAPQTLLSYTVYLVGPFFPTKKTIVMGFR